MLVNTMLNPILRNDAMTRGLADPEARILIEWLVERAEDLATAASCVETAQESVGKLCRRGRAISRFVALWCHQRERGGAAQLAVAERFAWPLPLPGADPCELMHDILDWETRHLLQ